MFINIKNNGKNFVLLPFKLYEYIKMLISYSNDKSMTRGYSGLFFDYGEFENIMLGAVRDNLNDKQERALFEADLINLTTTGFSSDRLLADIQQIQNATPDDLRAWRIGEAFAAVILEQEMPVRFHWNERRDARNLRANKTGADLVGFIELEGSMLFLFGEVKTSSETANRPPQVMTGGAQMEEQLLDLYENKEFKRFNLIQYLASKTRNLAGDNQFKLDYKDALASYYREDGFSNYQLIGILVRDVEPNEEDLIDSFNRLNTAVLEPIGIRLLACYTPVEKENWGALIALKNY